MIVETSRALLRPVGRGDIDDLVQLDSDPLVMRYVSGGKPTSRATIEDWVIPRAQAELAGARGGLWTVTDRRYGEFLGWMSLRGPRHSDGPEMELSYRLRREYWGRGLATEAARAVVTVAFGHLGAQRVFAGTTAANTGSRRVMEKLGMVVSRIHMSDDDPLGGGEVEYELLRVHWDTRTRGWMRPPESSADLTA